MAKKNFNFFEKNVNMTIFKAIHLWKSEFGDA